MQISLEVSGSPPFTLPTIVKAPLSSAAVVSTLLNDCYKEANVFFAESIIAMVRVKGTPESWWFPHPKTE